MSKILERLWYIENTNKSKVKFNWNFEEELKSLMEMVEKATEGEIDTKYELEYIDTWKADIKIKIADDERGIYKLITCNFTYNNTDEKFWYIDPQFLVTKLSNKTQVYNLWKFPIKDKKKIIKKFIEKLIFIIEEY